MHRLLVILALLLNGTALAGEVLDVVPDLYAPREASAPDPAAAGELLAKAQQAADAGEVSAALQFATRVLRYDPDNATCRRVLGYEHVDGRWLTSFQAKQIARGFVWDIRFGWIKADDLPRYEAGERRDGRKWRTTQEDAARHAVIEDGWRVRTDHFQVTTNHSLAAAARLASELESLFQVWRQLFAGYYLGEAEVRARFAGTRTARSRSRPFNVFYHRDRAGYVAHLRHKNPQVIDSLGVYFDDTREAHFFADAEVDAAERRATLYHEAVHQLFQESRRARRGVGEKHHNWAVEGVACYFESLAPTDDGRYEIGGPNAGRLPYARGRLVKQGYFVPLEEMVSLGRKTLQARSDIAPLYGQASSFATYLMHADEGRRREAFVRYLAVLYSGKARPEALADALDQPLDNEQRDFQRWMASPFE